MSIITPMILLTVAFLALADARLLHHAGSQLAPGNTDANSALREWATEYASLGTPAALAAADTDAKAYYTAEFDPKAAKLSLKAAALHSMTSSTLTAKIAGRLLLSGGKATGNNNANGAQRVWAVEGTRNMFASQGTSDAIAAAANSGKAYFAASFGAAAAKATTLRAAASAVFTDKGGARHLLGDRTDRQDRNSIAIQATADMIQSALAAKSATTASKAGLQFSKLATSNSVRASDFTGAKYVS